MSKPWVRGVLIILGISAVSIGIWYMRHPERIVKQALRHAAAANTQKFKGELVIENAAQTKDLIGEEAHLEIKLEGDYHKQAANNIPAIQSNLAVSIASESVTLHLAGETRFLNDAIYLYIKNSPAVFPILQSLRGQWLQIPRERPTDNSSELPSEEIITSAHFAGREKIGDETVNKYAVEASRAAVVHFMDHLTKILGSRLTDAQVRELKNNLSQIEHIPLEVWIAPTSQELRQLKVVMAAANDNDVALTVQLTGANQPVTIEVPPNPVPIIDAVRQLQTKNQP